MELYQNKSSSFPQKIVLITLELGFLWLAYWILFQAGGSMVYGLFGFETEAGNYGRRFVTYGFSIIVFIRMLVTFFCLLKRSIPWEEALSIPFAFALYYVGFSLLAYGSQTALNWIDYIAIAIFLIGSGLNTISEIERHFWKKNPENRGKLYTKGLFKYSMHINYFGDLLWVLGYVIVSRNVFSVGILLFLLIFFVFFNIPKLDDYLADNYKDDFFQYRETTAKLIPFIY